MSEFTPTLLFVPVFLTAALCLAARRVNEGNTGAQSFEILHQESLKRWQSLLDLMLIVVIAAFVLLIDESGAHSVHLFLEGLYYLSGVAILLSCIGYFWSSAWMSVVLRKVAFRAILCLALFIMVIGMKAAGVGAIERSDDLIRLDELRR